jgi:hypothetical protein
MYQAEASVRGESYIIAITITITTNHNRKIL